MLFILFSYLYYLTVVLSTASYFVILNIFLSCWVLDLLNPELLFNLILTTSCQTCVQNSPYLLYLVRMYILGFFLLMIQHVMNILGIFDILEYP